MGDDPYTIVLAANGFEKLESTCDGANARLTLSDESNELIKLTLQSPENREVKWSINFTK